MRVIRLFILAFAVTFSNIGNAQKIMNVIGDSYVANHRKPFEESWHYKLAKEQMFTYENFGRNGNCVAFDRTHDNGKNWGEAMVVRYKVLNQSADYVIIIAGHNDADKIKNNSDSLKMFRDSLDIFLTEVESHCPKAKIGYVTPWYVDRPGFKQVCKAIKKVCKKHHIPVLWNYDKKCIIQVRDSEFRKMYFQGANDTAHLNEKGHNLFLPVAREWFNDKLK